MILCIDIGNTNVVMGLFDDGKLIGQARFATSNLKTSDECGLRAYHLVQRHHPENRVEVDGVIICSVVPFLTPRMAKMSRNYLNHEPVIVSSELDLGISVKVRTPQEVGADRLVNAVAALSIYEDNCIVIDLGTATTFDLVSREGEYLGGAIAPGLEASLSGLTRKAAQLFSVEIAPPDRCVGKSTEEALKSGIFWGQVEMINGMIIRIEDEFKQDCKIVFTGGYGHMFANYIDREAEYSPTLTLQGLRIIYENLK